MVRHHFTIELACILRCQLSPAEVVDKLQEVHRKIDGDVVHSLVIVVTIHHDADVIFFLFEKHAVGFIDLLTLLVFFTI